MIQIYCGDGKGKTTAAAGLAIRAAGHGFPVVFAQFLKDDSSKNAADNCDAWIGFFRICQTDDRRTKKSRE